MGDGPLEPQVANRRILPSHGYGKRSRAGTFGIAAECNAAVHLKSPDGCFWNVGGLCTVAIVFRRNGITRKLGRPFKAVSHV